MKNFENVYILKGSLTEEKAIKEIENIKQYFKDVKVFDNNGNIKGKIEYLGLKRLAYTINGETTGYFYVTHFEGTENEILKIERQLRLNDNVIKFITIKV